MGFSIQNRLGSLGGLAVIEHNLDVISCSELLIGLGLEGGDKGTEIVEMGTPEEVEKKPFSHTGRHFKYVLEQHSSKVLAA